MLRGIRRNIRVAVLDMANDDGEIGGDAGALGGTRLQAAEQKAATVQVEVQRQQRVPERPRQWVVEPPTESVELNRLNGYFGRNVRR